MGEYYSWVKVPPEFREALPTPDVRKWAEFIWPDWVPEILRKQIEEFWREDWGRGPQAWIECNVQNGGPPLGTEVWLPRNGYGGFVVKGRFVHAWNNQARLVHGDGTWSYTTIDRSALKDPEAYRQRELEQIRSRRAELEAQMAELNAAEARMLE